MNALRRWAVFALLVTFLAGGSTGFLVHDLIAAPAERPAYLDLLDQTLDLTPGQEERILAILESEAEQIRRITDQFLRERSSAVGEIKRHTQQKIESVFDDAQMEKYERLQSEYTRGGPGVDASIGGE